LVPSSKLPEFVHQIPAPDGIKFAHNSPQEYELVGREEAEKMFLKINSQLGRSYGEKDVDRFMSHLDLNNDGAIDFEEFKNAYHKLLN